MSIQAMANDLMGAISQPNPENHLVCVGCDNFRAANQDELREHYKTEWHRHNLKRKVQRLHSKQPCSDTAHSVCSALTKNLNPNPNPCPADPTPGCRVADRGACADRTGAL